MVVISLGLKAAPFMRRKPQEFRVVTSVRSRSAEKRLSSLSRATSSSLAARVKVTMRNRGRRLLLCATRWLHRNSKQSVLPQPAGASNRVFPAGASQNALCDGLSSVVTMRFLLPMPTGPIRQSVPIVPLHAVVCQETLHFSAKHRGQPWAFYQVSRGSGLPTRCAR